MTVSIDEQVRVAAVFAHGRVKPVWFDWKGRQIRLKETAYDWTTREGRAVVIHFSVSDGANLYEICWNRETLVWTLTCIKEL